nr:peptide chain release factor 1 [Roseomonas sp. SXEYE001]
MTEAEAETTLAELDRLLNDPDVRMDPARVWALAGRLSAPSQGSTTGSPAN